MKKDPIIFLQHMLEEIIKIENSTRNMTKQEFLINLDVQDAVIRRIEIIGEAAKNVPKEFKDEHKHVDWKKIAGARDVLIHAYFSVDLNLIWDIIKNDLQKLKENLQEIVKTLA